MRSFGGKISIDELVGVVRCHFQKYSYLFLLDGTTFLSGDDYHEVISLCTAAPPEKIRQLEANELEEISISREQIAKNDPLWCV